MSKALLVPLDGSPFAEQALPSAVRLAERDGARLDLLHVFETAVSGSRTQAAPPIDPTLDRLERAAAIRYMDEVLAWVRSSARVPVTGRVEDGPVAETIAHHIARHEIDLVVMCTHGRSGISRAWLGSTADALLRAVTVPMLMLRPEMDGARSVVPRTFTRVLVPLDGKPESEAAIDDALQLAGDPEAELVLMRVVSPVFPVYYGAQFVGAPPLDVTGLREDAEHYLRLVGDDLRRRGVRVEERVVIDPATALAILSVAEEMHVDAVAMATHARGPMGRLFIGSVADKVVRGAAAPVLVHHVVPAPAASAPFATPAPGVAPVPVAL